MSELIYKKNYTVKAPSNIALVKYWGKEHRQIPMNPSLSFTLTNAQTKMSLRVTKAQKFSLKVIFKESENKSFSLKLEKKVYSLIDYFPWLNEAHLEIQTSNTFPHSAGIASSASSMCALAYLLLSVNRDLTQIGFDQEKHSEVSRILSGSASRSVAGPLMLWGKMNNNLGTNNFAVPIRDIDKIFLSFQDTILVIDDEPKALSSSKGHALMNGHPYRDARKKLATDHCKLMLEALKTGKLDLFGHILEQEALGLHGLMLTSDPSYTLLKPQTLEVIEELKIFRAQTGCHCYFTLDAGPNIHLLYPSKDEGKVKEFIKNFDFKDVLFDKINLEVIYEYE